LGELNADASIVVLIDEAHRSNTALGADLHEALTKAARIGFTGPPIMIRLAARTASRAGEVGYG
jgi:type I restriction enzyme R subunit